MKENSVNSNLNFPAQLSRYPDDENRRWEIVDDLYAKSVRAADPPKSDEVIRVDPTTAVCRSTEKKNDCAECGPVYRLVPHGQICVATGLIFVTLEEASSYDQLEEAFKAVGFTIEEQSPTGGFWLRHKSGSIKSALENYLAVSKLKQVKTTEPQFLSQRVGKRGKRRF